MRPASSANLVSSPQRIRLLGFFALCIAACLFALPDQTGALAGVLLSVIGVGLIALKAGEALYSPPDQTENPLPSRRWWHWLAMCGGGLMLAYLTDANARNEMFYVTVYLPTLAQVSLFAGGTGLLVWGLAGSRRILPRWHPEIGPVLVLMLLAFVLRVIGLEDWLRVLVDEMNTVGEILAIRHHEVVNILHPMTRIISPYPWHFAILQYAGAELLGPGFAGMRLASAVTGTLTLPALYLLAREIVSRRTALLALLLLATFPPHIHMSRLALLNIADGLFGILALGFFLRGLRTDSRVDFVLAGASLGLTHYFFEGGRLFFTPFMLLVILYAAVFWRDTLRGRWRGIGMMLLTALLLVLPLYIAWVAIEMPLAGRLGVSGKGETYWLGFLLSPADTGWASILLDNLGQSFLLYVGLPEQSPFYGGPAALVLPWLAPFLFTGVALSLRHTRKTLSLPFLLVFMIALVNGLFLVSTTALTRYMAAVPALTLLIAMGMTWAWETLLQPYRARWKPSTARLIALGLICIATGLQVIYYFGQHLPYFREQTYAARSHPNVDDAMLRAAQLPPETKIHVFISYTFDPVYAHNFLVYLTGVMEATTLQTDAIPEDYFQALSHAVPHAFFIEPGDEATLQQARAYFELEGPFWSPFADIPRDKQFALYTAQAAAVESQSQP